jgi:hypothetical protein
VCKCRSSLQQSTQEEEIVAEAKECPDSDGVMLSLTSNTRPTTVLRNQTCDYAVALALEQLVKKRRYDETHALHHLVANARDLNIRAIRFIGPSALGSEGAFLRQTHQAILASIAAGEQDRNIIVATPRSDYTCVLCRTNSLRTLVGVVVPIAEAEWALHRPRMRRGAAQSNRSAAAARELKLWRIRCASRGGRALCFRTLHSPLALQIR